MICIMLILSPVHNLIVCLLICIGYSDPPICSPPRLAVSDLSAVPTGDWQSSVTVLLPLEEEIEEENSNETGELRIRGGVLQSSAKSTSSSHHNRLRGDQHKEELVNLNRPKQFLCQVLADPPQVEFTWYLNNSFSDRRFLARGLSISQAHNKNSKTNNNKGEEFKQQQQATSWHHHHATNETNQQQHYQSPEATYLVAGPNLAKSRLILRPASELDFGQIYCVARNELGEQRNPCLHGIRSSGPESRSSLRPLNNNNQNKDQVGG